MHGGAVPGEAGEPGGPQCGGSHRTCDWSACGHQMAQRYSDTWQKDCGHPDRNESECGAGQHSLCGGGNRYQCEYHLLPGGDPGYGHLSVSGIRSAGEPEQSDRRGFAAV